MFLEQDLCISPQLKWIDKTGSFLGEGKINSVVKTLRPLVFFYFTLQLLHKCEQKEGK